jgi:hypothetical protein
MLASLAPDERRRAAEEARAVFSRLRATALLGLLDDALERHPLDPLAAPRTAAPPAEVDAEQAPARQEA